MIDEIKTHVSDCGGDTHLVSIDYDGNVKQYPQEEITATTERLRVIDRLARHIAGTAMDPDSDDEQVRATIASTIAHLRPGLKLAPEPSIQGPSQSLKKKLSASPVKRRVPPDSKRDR